MTDFQRVADSLGYFNGNRFATYGEYRIISAFQPIYSIAHRRIVGLEGLARGIDSRDRLVPPAELFRQTSAESISSLDQICQMVHIDNFYALNPENAWLFLNVDPVTLRQRERYMNFLVSLLEQKSYSAARCVIEVLESTIDSEERLEEDIRAYHDLGFLIAIDDFGSGHSNFERIWRIKPDIVKLDRSMVKKAGVDPSVKNLLKGITSMLHNCKCIVLAMGIETEQEAMAAMDAEVDLVQGFYFARPFLLSEPIKTQPGLWQDLYSSFDSLSSRNRHATDALLAPYASAFSRALTAVSGSIQLEDIARDMFQLTRTIRLYQLALDGSQCHSNINSPAVVIADRDRLKALANTTGASWKRRGYFLNALNNPGNVQITEPYFSISDGTLCITLSVLTRIAEGEFIVCCDLLCE